MAVWVDKLRSLHPIYQARYITGTLHRHFSRVIPLLKDAKKGYTYALTMVSFLCRTDGTSHLYMVRKETEIINDAWMGSVLYVFFVNVLGSI